MDTNLSIKVYRFNLFNKEFFMYIKDDDLTVKSYDSFFKRISNLEDWDLSIQILSDEILSNSYPEIKKTMMPIMNKNWVIKNIIGQEREMNRIKDIYDQEVLIRKRDNKIKNIIDE